MILAVNAFINTLLGLFLAADNNQRFVASRVRGIFAREVMTMALEQLRQHLTGGLAAFEEVVRVPDFSVLLGGKSLSALSDRLISLQLTDNRGFDADQLTLSIDDAAGDIELPPRGAELSVSLGWKGAPLVYKGIYTVDEVSHSGPPDALEITARSADFRDEFNVKREVSWHNVTVERVVSAIARRYELKPAISESLMDIEIDHADQTQESDMSFLTRMAEMLGAIATVKNGNLLFITPGAGVSASGKPLPAALITRSSGDRHSFRIADRDSYTGVRAYWLDLNFGKKKSVKVRPRKAANKPASSSREGDYIEGAEGNIYVMRKTYPNETTARRAAAAKWQQLQRGAAQFSLTLARGQAELFPDVPVSVSGFKPQIDARPWVITRVEHVIDGSGFTTRLDLEAKISDWIAESGESG